ncbi:MAG: DUF411 domain-containing protein [Gammaproteobacteria bacterium]|nr:DUF411 domain-containing protein [Gammaproteobacteria bacterium]
MRNLPILLLLLASTSLFAENPRWKSGLTDQRYDITVYRSVSCGCCKGWIDHLEDHHFNVNDVTVDNVQPYKTKYGVPPKAASCHTAVVNDLIVEGHVPAQDIKRLLGEKSDIRLLTVPGMPSGTPGMDMPESRKDTFSVYSVTHVGEVGEYSRHSNY